MAALVARHGLDEDQHRRLEQLLEALASEPDPHTTASSPEAATRVHLADSLSALVVPAVSEADTIADVGAGAGFPGLALAVARPRAAVFSIESAGRKAAVVQRLVEAAGLENVTVVSERAEEHARAEGRGRYELVTARAVAPLAVLVEYAAPLLAVDGTLVAWKGRRDSAEEEAGASAARATGMEVGEVRRVEPYEGARDHHLQVYRKVGRTPVRFPRRAGVARKRPLA